MASLDPTVSPPLHFVTPLCSWRKSFLISSNFVGRRERGSSLELVDLSSALKSGSFPT